MSNTDGKPKERFRYSPPANLLALAGAAVLIHVLFIPVVYLMAVTTCREIFPWFIWYQAYLDWSSFILGAWLWLPLPFLFLTAFYLLRHVIGRLAPRWRTAVPKRWNVRRVAAWLLIAPVMLASGLSFAPLAFFGAVNIARTFPAPGRSLQRAKCSVCHSPYRPFHFIKEPEQWQVTVDRMRSLEGAQVGEEEAGTIVAYLKARASYTDAWIFRAKCLRCHGRDTLQARPRTAEEWQMIGRRMARLSPYAYRTEWLRQLDRYTAAELAQPSPGGEEYLAKIHFERACGACHQLRLVLEPHEEKIDELVRRMAAKAPGIIAPDEMPAFTEYTTRIMGERERFGSLFPHDQRIEVSW